jgi:hypothetical protein
VVDRLAILIKGKKCCNFFVFLFNAIELREWTGWGE